MKRLGICFGIGGLLLGAACAEDPVTPNNHATSGSGGSAPTAGTPAGGTAPTGGSNAGAGMTAGTATGGSSAGTAAGGSAGAAGAVSVGGGGSGGSAGGGACETKAGKALKFAGDKIDSVAGDLGTDAELGDKPRTLELWAKFTSAKSWTAEHSIIELGTPGNPDNGNNVFGIDMSGRNGGDGVFGPYTHGVSDNNGNNAMPKLTAVEAVGWLHLSWSYDPTKNPANTRLQFTVNGDVLPTQFDQAAWDKTSGKLVGNTGFVLLGSSQNFGPDDGGWDGVMDEVRIWSVARTAAEIKADMNVIMKPTTPGLLAYYQFNETDLTNVKDSTGNAAHKLAACTAAAGACSRANTQPPTFVDSDVPPFTCAP